MSVEISKSAMKLLTDVDFVEMRIIQQHEYIRELQNRQRWQRYEAHSRIQELIESAREREKFFRSLLNVLQNKQGVSSSVG